MLYPVFFGCMRKIILLISWMSVCVLPSSAQLPDSRNMMQLKIQLPFLDGFARADCLNKIAYEYVESGVVRSDSGILYARQAVEYAEKNNFKKQLLLAASLYAKVLLQLSKPNEGLVYYRLTLRLANELKDDAMAALGTRGIGQSRWYQGNYQEAVHVINISIDQFKKLGNIREVSSATMVISNIYGEQGNYEKAFEVALEALRLSSSLNDVPNIILSLTQLGELYRNIGDYATAMEYYQRGYGYNAPKVYWCSRHLANSMGDLYRERQQFDSAFYFYQQGYNGNPTSKTTRLRLGEYYLDRERYDTAFSYFFGLYNDLKDGGEGHLFVYSMLGIGKVYLYTKNSSKAIQYGNEALEFAGEKGIKKVVRDACQLLAVAYEELKEPEIAFFYYKQYVQMKDSLITDQFKGKLYAFRKMADDEKTLAQIELLKKEKLIGDQKLEGNRLLRNILAGGIVFLILLGIIVFWNITLKRKNEKLKNERIQTELQRKATDLEMQALRAQMNPHFIFNCLSSINRFILKNEPDKASDYLTRFSRLIRLVLINSQKSLIVLEDEVEMLRLYIEMERLRFKNSFDYSIVYTNNIEQSNILIPPLLLQPFCENAIWHGLMHKEGHGHLSVAFNVQHNILFCTITDDGIGRARAGEINSRSAEKLKSLGLQLTAERLALFNEDRSVQTFYKIEDVTDGVGNCTGTRVIIEIRYKEFVEETV
jgi:tetratricopeptide (TPR) repeat protein